MSEYTINYQAIITRFSWWEDIKARKFVIVGIELIKIGDSWKHDSVSLLEQYKQEPQIRPWNEIIALIEAGKFTKL